MATTYKITFKPVEPYFFGNEKASAFPVKDGNASPSVSSYFIRSEDIPSQSTILGALRYLFLAHKNPDFKYTEEQAADNAKAVGPASFDIASEDVQKFGLIRKISPVFISGNDKDGKEVSLIPTPMDHNRKDSKETRKSDPQAKLYYSPFNDYLPITTAEEQKLYANDFDVKEGLEKSFVSLSDGEIYKKEKIFEADLRIGINRATQNDGFFKKEYKMLKEGFAFTVYAELEVATDNEIISRSQCIFLGQGKSAFSVRFEKSKDELFASAESFLKSYSRTNESDRKTNASYSFFYCLSDTFVSSFDTKKITFCAIDTKDYRAFRTVFKDKEKFRFTTVKKGNELYRLLKAGSIIITKDEEDFELINRNENANRIGFNSIIKIGGINL